MRPRLLLLLLLGVGLANAEPFSIAVIPDAQQEVLRADDTRLRDRLQWLVAQRAALNLQVVLQVGDLLNWDTPDHAQYERASAAFRVLDEAGLPYVTCLGNHDTAATKEGGSAAPGNVHDNLRTTNTYNQYFPLSRFRLLQGTCEPNKIDNAWHVLRAGGLNWLLLNLELWPRAVAIEWAKGLIAQHPRHNVLLLTHSFVTGGGAIEQLNGGYGDHSPQFVYDQLVAPYPQVRAVFSGHTGSHGYWRRDRADGSPFHQFLQCYHDNTTNPVRLVTIDPAEGTLRSRVACPSLGQDKADGSTFELRGLSWVQP
ncbi:MAG: metallophosphoesterase [Fimbriimonadaceae bacterium]|nr:metallophosphoesterase [Fimbriimonadaceae bacterium]